MSGGIFSQAASEWDDDTSDSARPIEWSEKKGNRLTLVQKAIKESVRDHRYTAVPSCHDSGKSFVAADIVAWWVDAHLTGQSLAVTTAPTSAQVKAILWQEITTIHERAELKGKINRGAAPEWYAGSTLVGLGRKPADYNTAAFQGLHSLYPLIVIDEAGGVARAIFDAVDTFATNRNARVLAIGNPDDPTSYFAQICKPDSGWNVIQIDGLRTPNMTKASVAKQPRLKALMEAEGIPYSEENIPTTVRDVLLSPEWIEERLARWAGVTLDDAPERIVEKAAASQLFLSKVRGIFPPIGGGNSVIPLGWVELAMNRWDDWADAGKPEQVGRRIVGADIARGGQDQTCLSIRQGMVTQRIMRSNTGDTMETTDYVSGLVNWPRALGVIDVIGIGAGVLDRLRQMSREGTIIGDAIGFNASAQSKRTDILMEFKFFNDRSAAWWRMRELLDPSRNSKIALPRDEELKEELTAPTYKVLTGGVIKVEEKDDVKDRIGRSTDSADATIQSYWVDGLDPGHIDAGETSNVVGQPVKFTSQRQEGAFRYAGYTPFGQQEEDW